MVKTLHMISPCLHSVLSETMRSRSKGMTKQVVKRSETATDNTKHAPLDCRRGLVLSMTKQTKMFASRYTTMIRPRRAESTILYSILWNETLGVAVKLLSLESFMVVPTRNEQMLTRVLR